MLSKLSRFIERHLQPVGDDSKLLSTHQKNVAIAALLVEVALADHKFSNAEVQQLSESLTRRFFLTKDEITDLVECAKDETSRATSLNQFTQLINQCCNQQEKFTLVTAMWEIAYADNVLDKYEDYIIRKIADLIYVPHAAFIRAKNIVKSTI